MAIRLTGTGFGLVCFDSPSTLVAKFSFKQLQIPNKTRSNHKVIIKKKMTIRYKSDNWVQKRQHLFFSAFRVRMFMPQFCQNENIFYSKSAIKFDIIWQRNYKTLILHREVEQR